MLASTQSLFVMQAPDQNTSTIQSNIDPNCQVFANNACSTCNRGYYILNGTCTQASILCARCNSSTGACTSCYSGYYINGTKCLKFIKDSNCINYKFLVCVQCINMYYVNNTVCVKVSNLCQTADSTGNCTSCVAKYQLQNGGCVPFVADPYCKTFNGQSCSQCIDNFEIFNGRCVMKIG
jgi:hypothetical protein